MKTLLIIITALILFGCDIVDTNTELPTKVFLTERYLADYTIYVTTSPHEADMKITLVTYKYQAVFTAYITDKKYNADKIVVIQ